MKMERTAEVIRGWPFDGALDLNEPIKSGVTLVNGDWVTPQSDNTVDKAGSTATAAAGLVVQGNGDSGSAANSNKALVLWGNFIAKISNYAAGTYAPGDSVNVANGVIKKAGAGEAVLGTVLKVVAVSSTQTAHLVIKVA